MLVGIVVGYGVAVGIGLVGDKGMAKFDVGPVNKAQIRSQVRVEPPKPRNYTANRVR